MMWQSSFKALEVHHLQPVAAPAQNPSLMCHHSTISVSAFVSFRHVEKKRAVVLDGSF